MLAQVARDYLQRFSNLMTESVYASKGLEDYSRMKRYQDYLDYDRHTLFREKGKAEAGLRNIGNTCYLNVILQLLFHVNYLREKVFTSEVKSALVRQVRALFGEMAIGRLAFADPSELFEQLKAANPEVFVAGVQNDFHEIFTLLIDQLSEGYREASPEEARFISKLLFGRMATRIDFQEGKTSKSATFNIINLDVAEGSFDRAFDRWKHYKIEGYETPKGARVTALAENVFLETPALMTFFINRVSYKDNRLQKDSRVFDFERSILVNKCQQSEKTKQVRPNTAQKEQEYLQERAALLQWLERVDAHRAHLKATLAYLRAKEAPLLSEPHVENPLGEAALASAASFLERELEVMEAKAEEVRREVGSLEERLKRLEEEGNYETYLLWAVMIHEGSSAVHGHYKVCISINDSWFEYNDRLVSAVPASRIEEYKARGEICCLFYRRPTLLCDSQRIPVPLSLKSLVGQQEREARAEIDKARLLQSLYQETESANILLEHEIHYGQQERFQYFFKPVHFALEQRLGTEACKGVIIMQTIASDAFRNALANRLVGEDTDLNFHRTRFGIPEEYFAAQDILRTFLSKEALMLEVPAAYEELAAKRFKFTSAAVRERYFEMLEIIILKGLYYLKAMGSALGIAGFTRVAAAIDRLLETMDQSSQFALVVIAIKSSIRAPEGEGRERSTLKAITIDNFGEYFSENFRFWIRQREVLSKLDELNFTKGAPALPIKE